MKEMMPGNSKLPNLCTGIHRVYAYFILFVCFEHDFYNNNNNRICMWVHSVSRCYRQWNSRKIRCSLFLFSAKNA